MNEHALIHEIRRLLAADFLPRGGVIQGPGDDCAIVAPEAGRELLLTTDAAVEGVHFRLDWMDAETAGRRAMAANLSDVAAMAGRPRWALLALEMPRGTADETALALVRGAAREAALEGAAVVGGNLARTAGPVSLTITLAGDVEAGRALRRSGGRPGDELWASGRPGAARAGLFALERGRAGEPAAAPFLERFLRPGARVSLARDLRDRAEARAMIDLSDGLAQDLGHLARESGCGARLDDAALLLGLGADLRAFAASLGEDPLALALEGGEDYELLWASSPGAVAAARADLEARHGLPLVRVGTLEAAPGLRRADGSPLLARGFDHFSG